MKTQVLKNLLKNTNGRFFTVTFVKQDGTLRTMNARVGVTSHIKGTGTSRAGTNDKYLTVFDAQKRAYRTINLDTIKSAKIDGVTFLIA